MHVRILALVAAHRRPAVDSRTQIHVSQAKDVERKWVPKILSIYSLGSFIILVSRGRMFYTHGRFFAPTSLSSFCSFSGHHHVCGILSLIRTLPCLLAVHQPVLSGYSFISCSGLLLDVDCSILPSICVRCALLLLPKPHSFLVYSAGIELHIEGAVTSIG